MQMAEEKTSKREQIGKYVYKQIMILTNNIKDSGNKATLARMRRGVGKTPGEVPELWGIILDEIPQELLSNNGKPTKAIWAIYISLTMFALHQQSNNESVHQNNISLGNAMFKLLNEPTDKERERVMRRFKPLIKANDIYAFSKNLQYLIRLIQSKNIKLDYVMLAKDIYDFQFSEGKKRVQLRWGQDFYKTNVKENNYNECIC